MEIVLLNREEYLNSIREINHYESLKFAKKAMDWWDNYYSWSRFPALSLVESGKNLCYLFFHISKDREYLTVHNILTPLKYRKNGYAFMMLKELFSQFSYEHIERFKMFCVSSSLNFYNRVGLNYWGVNSLGHYYSDFEMPNSNIDEIPDIVKSSNLDDLSNRKLKYIYNKVKLNGRDFDDKEMDIHERCLNKIKEKYLFEALLHQMEKVKLI